VIRELRESFSLLLDPETYLISFRLEERKSAGGHTTTILTRYGDYRPVEGVLLPHEFAISIDGRITQETRIETMMANPELTSETFRRPVIVPVKNE
jgi:hypothetical protein